MSDSPPAPPAAQGHGRIMLLSVLSGTLLAPAAVWCAMLAYDHFDPMCGEGGEGGIACALRALVVTGMSIVPGLLIGVGVGLFLASRRGKTNRS